MNDLYIIEFNMDGYKMKWNVYAESEIDAMKKAAIEICKMFEGENLKFENVYKNKE